MERIRSFVAVELPPEIRDALSRPQERLRASGEGIVRWVAPQGIHLTLKFLGDVDADTVPAISGALARAVTGFTPFGLGLGRPGFFPSQRRPRVFWVGLEGEVERVRALAGRVEAELAPLGLPREDRPFTPHLTLARLREGLAPARGEEFARAALSTPWRGVQEFTVGGINLMRSQLTPRGAIYSRLARLDFSLTRTNEPH